ncbi:uncharacterized protein LOC131319004 isoform X2 [Rhododendron vialii]|uniref:uncharacterized protein LOC131319004 isoform X2 n=1 Tax=Rhododendron vialii TaxID=182163 RepID=UPI00265F31AB|nr:uncharacterized protein LOC131319004 isoform X2 [Rhododendron vialii]
MVVLRYKKMISSRVTIIRLKVILHCLFITILTGICQIIHHDLTGSVCGFLVGKKCHDLTTRRICGGHQSSGFQRLFRIVGEFFASAFANHRGREGGSGSSSSSCCEQLAENLTWPFLCRKHVLLFRSANEPIKLSFSMFELCSDNFAICVSLSSARAKGAYFC